MSIVRALGLLVVTAWLGFSARVGAHELVLEGGISTDLPAFQAGQGNSTLDFSAGTGIAVGGFLGVPIVQGFRLETGVMYLPRHFIAADSSIPDVSTDQGYNSLFFPLVFRWSVLPLVSIGTGPYYMVGVGQISVTRTLAGVTVSTVSRDFNTTGGIQQAGFGGLGSIRLDFPVAPLIRLVLDGRYLMDFAERGLGSNSGLKFRDLQILGGMAFFL